jgi:hypothetical protein
VDSVEVMVYEGGRDKNTGYAACMTDSGGGFHLIVHRGQIFDMYLVDSRMASVRLPAALPGTSEFDEEQEFIERLHARVIRRWVRGLIATQDSTFDVTLESTSP